MWLLPCACSYAICAALDLRKSACLIRLSNKLSARTRELSKVLQLRRPFGQHLTTAGSNQTTGTNQSACGLLKSAGPGPALSLVGAVCASINAYSALHQLSFSSCVTEPETSAWHTRLPFQLPMQARSLQPPPLDTSWVGSVQTPRELQYRTPSVCIQPV